MLGNNIKKHRETQGLTQANLGTMVCSSAAAVSSWERGNKIAYLISCSVMQLLDVCEA